MTTTPPKHLEKKPQKPWIRKFHREVLVEKRSKENMEKGKKKKPMESVDLEDEELETGVEDISVDEAKLISRLPPYMLSRKLIAKVTKGPDLVKFSICTPLLPEDVPFEGELLA